MAVANATYLMHFMPSGENYYKIKGDSVHLQIQQGLGNRGVCSFEGEKSTIFPHESRCSQHHVIQLRNVAMVDRRIAGGTSFDTSEETIEVRVYTVGCEVLRMYVSSEMKESLLREISSVAPRQEAITVSTGSRVVYVAREAMQAITFSQAGEISEEGKPCFVKMQDGRVVTLHHIPTSKEKETITKALGVSGVVLLESSDKQAWVNMDNVKEITLGEGPLCTTIFSHCMGNMYEAVEDLSGACATMSLNGVHRTWEFLVDHQHVPREAAGRIGSAMYRGASAAIDMGSASVREAYRYLGQRLGRKEHNA